VLFEQKLRRLADKSRLGYLRAGTADFCLLFNE